MKSISIRGLFFVLLALTACGGQGQSSVATAPVHGAPTFIPAALARAAIPRRPTFAVPRAPDAAMRASRSDSTATHDPFFSYEAALTNGVYYLSFSSGSFFGYYSYLSDPHYIYHFDAGYEYTFDAADGYNGIYFYDFTSQHYWYTNPSEFPYLYDFTFNNFIYYYAAPNDAGHYTSDPRYFYNFSTMMIFTM